MDAKATGVEVAVQTFGAEGLRIVSLIIGFAVVQLVLLLAAYRSKRQNVNKLISFVLLLAGSVGVITLIALPIVHKLESFGKHVIISIVGAIVAAMLVMGILIQMGYIRIPFAKVGVIGDVSLSRAKANLESVASVRKQPNTWDMQTMYDQGIRWFIGFHDDNSIKQDFSFIATHQDSVFLSIGSSKTRMAHPGNILRLMSTEQDQLNGAKCFTKAKNMFVVGNAKVYGATVISPQDAVEPSKDPNNAIYLALNSEQLEDFVEKYGSSFGAADLWVSQSAAFLSPSPAVWQFLKAKHAKLQMAQSFAMKPFKNTKDVLSEEAMTLVYECVLGAQEDLRTTVDILKFIKEMPQFVKFNTNGDRDAESLLILTPSSKEMWEFKGKFTTCKSN